MPVLAADDSTMVIYVIIAFGALVVLLVLFAIFMSFFSLWIQSFLTGAGVTLWDLIGMKFRKVNSQVIVKSKIMAITAGIDNSEISTKALEAHFLARGNVPLVIRALIAAHKAKTIALTFREATAIDLAGRNVLEAVQTSVYPKVIDCPAKGSARTTLDAVAKNGIQLKVSARVTVRANLQQLIGGATEETIIARVGEGIVSAIGSQETHTTVLENPDLISKAVLARRLDSQTAFEIVSIDIADIDVGQNIGARLQADRAEADTRWHVLAPKVAARWPLPPSRNKSPGSKRAARSWSRPRPKFLARWPMPSVAASLASWTTTSSAMCKPTPKCGRPLRPPGNDNPLGRTVNHSSTEDR